MTTALAYFLTVLCAASGALFVATLALVTVDLVRGVRRLLRQS